MTSVKTRFVLVVGLLACASIAAVALALRQSTRQEFFKFQDLERQGAAPSRQRESARVASLLDGRCCEAAAVSAVAATLPPHLGLIVVDAAGAIRAQAGAAMNDMRDLSTSFNGSTLVLSGARQRGSRLERVELRLDGTGAPLKLADGASGQLFLITLPGSQPVDDLQELALADADELRLDIQNTNVATVAASSIEAAGLKEDPRLEVNIPPDLMVRADPVRLRQILLNLLTNADRYTPDGHRISIRGRSEGSRTIIEVANTGSTLDDAQLGRVFDRFYRTDSARHRATGGTGLGLAIVKSLVVTCPQ